MMCGARTHTHTLVLCIRAVYAQWERVRNDCEYICARVRAVFHAVRHCHCYRKTGQRMHDHFIFELHVLHTSTCVDWRRTNMERGCSGSSYSTSSGTNEHNHAHNGALGLFARPNANANARALLVVYSI